MLAPNPVVNKYSLSLLNSPTSKPETVQARTRSGSYCSTLNIRRPSPDIERQNATVDRLTNRVVIRQTSANQSSRGRSFRSIRTNYIRRRGSARCGIASPADCRVNQRPSGEWKLSYMSERCCIENRTQAEPHGRWLEFLYEDTFRLKFDDKFSCALSNNFFNNFLFRC